MLSHTIVVGCILSLMSCSKASIIEDFRTRFHKSTTRLSPNYLIAPDILEGRETFFVLDYEEITNQSPPQLRVLVRKYDDHQNGQSRECQLTLYARYNATKLGVSSLRRVNEDKVVFTWYDETNNGDRTTKVVFVNNQLCNTLDFQPNELPGNALLVTSVSETFDVIVDDVKFCGKYGKRCRVGYDLKQQVSGRYLPFNVTLDWPTIYVERLESGAFLIRGYENDLYKIMQMNHLTNQINDLIIISDTTRQMEIVSSGLAFCWILNPVQDNNVYCEQFNERGTNILQETLKYNQPMSLIDVRVTSDQGGIFVVTKRLNCQDEKDCWALLGTKIQSGQKDYQHLIMNFPCTGDQRKLTVFEAKPDFYYRRLNFYYACRRNDSYTFSAFFSPN